MFALVRKFCVGRNILRCNEHWYDFVRMQEGLVGRSVTSARNLPTLAARNFFFPMYHIDHRASAAFGFPLFLGWGSSTWFLVSSFLGCPAY